jgi:hypothetical protein
MAARPSGVIGEDTIRSTSRMQPASGPLPCSLDLHDFLFLLNQKGIDFLDGLIGRFLDLV